MYNEEIKKEYIESVSQHPDFSEEDLALTLCIFQTSEPYEQKFGKDLAYFNAIDIKDIYLEFGYGTRWQNLRLQKFINMYFRYMRKEYDSSVRVPRMPQEMIKDIILQGSEENNFYLSEENFISLIESLIEGHNSQLAFVFIAIYSGLYGDSWSEVTLAKKENINFEERSIKLYAYSIERGEVYYSRTIKVSEQFLKVATLANLETECKSSEGRVRGRYKKSDYIVKQGGIAEDNSDIADYINQQHMRCRGMLDRFKKSPDYAIPNISFESVRNFGIINFFLKLMKAFDEPIDKKEEAINNPYIIKPIMEKFNIDVFNLKKVIARYIK